jgi:large subunit ribosomal protein L10
VDRSQKSQQISEISDSFAKSKAAFLFDFKGMTVEQVTGLRKLLRKDNAEMRVVRNTLARLALKNHPSMTEALSEDFVGTNAIVFAFGDAGASAKALSNFAKDVEVMQIKCGVMEGKKLDIAGITYLATLPSKEVLRAQLLGLLQAPASKFVRTLAAAPSGLLTAMNAYKEKKEKEVTN